jgi:hypothetical protein
MLKKYFTYQVLEIYFQNLLNVIMLIKIFFKIMLFLIFVKLNFLNYDQITINFSLPIT